MNSWYFNYETQVVFIVDNGSSDYVNFNNIVHNLWNKPGDLKEQFKNHKTLWNWNLNVGHHIISPAPCDPFMIFSITACIENFYIPGIAKNLNFLVIYEKNIVYCIKGINNVLFIFEFSLLVHVGYYW